MLIEFNVKNFRSIRTTQVLNLAATKAKERLDTNTYELPVPNNMRLLLSAAIYGANAAGKSNVINALQTMRIVVLKSAVNSQRGDELPIDSFRLDSEYVAAPSEFEVTFIEDDVRYQYGFAATKQRVTEEWLFAYPKGRAQRWFTRVWDEKEKAYNWHVGPALQGEKYLWQKATRDNALFLSTAVHLNSEQLKPVFDWFKERLRLTNIGGWHWEFTANQCKKDKKKSILSFLRAADIGIDDIQIQKEKFNPDDLPSDIPNEMQKLIVEEMKDKEVLDVKTLHKSSDGEFVAFDLEEESDGTQKLFSLAGPWLDSLEKGRVLFVDELHDNLHPKLVEFLVQLFHNPVTNPRGAQLIFTTHETSILNQKIFRRDQIWFCKKNDNRSTKLYPLTDFGTRTRDNLEASYLDGRYGAVPFIDRLMD